MTIFYVPEEAKPVAFSDEMVRALLAGTKTETRRVLTARGLHDWEGERDMDGRALGRVIQAPLPASSLVAVPGLPASLYRPYPRRLGTVGQVLYVQESLACHEGWAIYRATGHHVLYRGQAVRWEWAPKVLAARYMRRGYTRLLLRVTGVADQWLRDITEEDARAEGMDWGRPRFYGEKARRAAERGREDPRVAGHGDGSSFARDNYQRLWDSLQHGPGRTWTDNPGVAVTRFAEKARAEPGLLAGPAS